MSNCFTFAGKSSKDFKVYISGQGTYNAPARVYSSYEIPGRSGDLFVDEKRYSNTDLTYPAFIFNDMKKNLEGFRSFLLSRKGYQRLEDTYHPDEFRMAIFKEDFEADIDQRHEVATFDIVFNCKPQRFLKSGEKTYTLTSSGSIRNPTDFESKPLIRVYGNGTVGIGSQSITLTGTTNYTDIDCEMMDCYYETENRNSKVVFTNYDFPVLLPGVNNISLGNGITKVEITPRWWRL